MEQSITGVHVLPMAVEFAKKHLNLNQKKLVALLTDPKQPYALVISEPVLTNIKKDPGSTTPFKYGQLLNALTSILLEHGFRIDVKQQCFIKTTAPKNVIPFASLTTNPSSVKNGELAVKGVRGSLKRAEDISVYAELDTSRLHDLIAYGQEIWVMTTYLSGTDDFERSFRRAIHHNPDCRIKVLLLDPHLSAAHLRAKGLRTSDRYALQTLTQNLNRLKKIESEFPDNFSLRLYNAVPSLCFYRVDDICQWGFFWFDKLTRDGTIFQMPFRPEDDPFSKDVKQHFGSLWNYAEEFHNPERFDVQFNCYFRYPEANKLVTKMMLLSIDTKNFDALLTDTPSQTDYHGHLILLREGNVCIHLLVKDASDQGSNSAFFDLHLNLANILKCEIASGLFTVSSPKERDCIFAKKVLLENTRLTESPQNKEALIEKVLGLEIIEDNLYGANSWAALERKLSGV